MSPPNEAQADQSKQVELTVLDTTIQIRKEQLQASNEKLLASKRLYQITVTSMKGDLAKQRRRLEALKNEFDKANTIKAALVPRIDEQNGTIKQLMKRTAELEKYHHTQQVLIDDNIEAGNKKLKQLTFGVGLIEEKEKEAKADLLLLNNQKSQLVDELGELQVARQSAREHISDEEKEKRDTLSHLIQQIEDAKTMLKSTTKEVNEKLASLGLKEKSIVAKRAALHKEQEEFRTEKRRYEAERGLYDV